MDGESASVTEEVSSTWHAAGADHVREDDDDDYDDAASDTDDNDWMAMEAPLMVLNSIVEKEQQIQQKQDSPLTCFTWNAIAITDCLAFSLQAHDESASFTIDEWTPRHEQEWKPQPVPLPECAMP